MKFVPEDLVLELDKEEVKNITGLLNPDNKKDQITIKKLIKYGNKINNKEENKK